MMVHKKHKIYSSELCLKDPQALKFNQVNWNKTQLKITNNLMTQFSLLFLVASNKIFLLLVHGT